MSFFTREIEEKEKQVKARERKEETSSFSFLPFFLSFFFRYQKRGFEEVGSRVERRCVQSFKC